MTDKESADINRWATIVGPCYTTVSFARVLGWSEAEVAHAAKALRVLQLITEDDVVVYPAFQLWNGLPVHGLPKVLHTLQSGTRGSWTWAQWLNTPFIDNHGVMHPSNIEMLRAGCLKEVLREAEHDAWAWRS